MFRLKPLPLPDPGEPDTRSAAHYLLWVFRLQWRTQLLAAAWATVWMVGLGVLPGVIGVAIDSGVAQRDLTTTAWWAAAIVGLAGIIAVAGILRHRGAVFNFLSGAYRTVQVTTRHATRVGAALPRHIATGEVVSIGGSDTSSIGMVLDTAARFFGSIASFVAVAAILLTTSVPLGAVILIGLPLQAIILGPLLRPLQRREHDYRAQQGALTSRANDIVAGLRVLRGIGGESLFTHRYAQQSARVRRYGVRVAASAAVVKALQSLLPGMLLLAVTWIGARMAVAGTLSTGQLVAVFGYTLFLATPMNVFLEISRKYTTAHAAARRIVRLLRVTPEVQDTGTTPMPADFDRLTDPDSGLELPKGTYRALVSADGSRSSEVGQRLGRYIDSDCAIGEVPLHDIPLRQLREAIMVTDNDALFFAGRLREQLDVHDRATTADIDTAIHVAVAADAVDSLGGLDGRLEAAARNISGGQRQRLRLVRALLSNPRVLILIEPTSAVDAHTESLIAHRLRQHRQGQTTLVATTSPLMLEAADQVYFVWDGKVIATGAHHELLESEPRYRAVVSRDQDAAEEDKE